jgi:hypothetical protein
MKLLVFFLFLHYQIHPTPSKLVSEHQALLSVKAAITDDPQLAFTTWNAQLCFLSNLSVSQNRLTGEHVIGPRDGFG